MPVTHWFAHYLKASYVVFTNTHTHTHTHTQHTHSTHTHTHTHTHTLRSVMIFIRWSWMRSMRNCTLSAGVKGNSQIECTNSSHMTVT